MDNKLSKKEIEFLVNQMDVHNMANDFIALLNGKKLHTVSVEKIKKSPVRLFTTEDLLFNSSSVRPCDVFPTSFLKFPICCPMLEIAVPICLIESVDE